MSNILLSCVLIFFCTIPSSTSRPEIGNNLAQRDINLWVRSREENVDLFTGYMDHSIQKRNFVNTSMRNTFPRPDQRSLVLVIDVTESMSTDLPQIQEGIKKIADTFFGSEDSSIYNYILVPFREENGKIETGPVLVTDDKDELLSTLHNIDLRGGDDCPENSLSALIIGLKHALPNSHMIVFTDASASDFRLEREVIDLIQEKQATVTILLTGYCDNKSNEKYKVYERLTRYSNGQVHHIKSNQIKEILSDFTTKLNKHSKLLTSTYATEADSSRWDFYVDDTVNKVELTVSGERPKIWIYRPDGKMARNVIKTLNLTHVQGYTIENPLPGVWQIDVESYSSHSVRISADSELSLSYRFSIQSQSSLLSTQLFPLNGTQNVLTIISNERVNLSEVLLLPNDADKRILLPLNKEKVSNEGEYLYETEAFNPPEFSFKILANGYNVNGTQLNRTISTTLRKLNGPPPEVILNTTNNIINEGETFLLRCTIHSMVPFLVRIQHEQKILKELQSKSSMNITHKIERTELEDSGQYSCNANSIFGSSNQTVNIKVTWVPLPPVTIPTVLTANIPKSEYIGTENQSLEIPCFIRVEPKTLVNAKWYFNDTKIDTDGNVYKIAGNNLIILNLTKELSGNYSCDVIADTETKSSSTMLLVQYAPILQQAANEEIFVKYGDSFNISCSGNAWPPAQSKWKLPSINEYEIFKSPLRIESFEESDEGLYECLLDNGIEPPVVRRVTLRKQE